MALLNNIFCRLPLCNSLLPYKGLCFNRISTSIPFQKLSVEEQLGIKPRPKRPKSSFLRFCDQVKPQILQIKPNASITEINRIAGERWRATDDKTKDKLKEEFRTDWAKYLEEIKSYNDKLSPSVKEELQKTQQAISENKKKRKLKQKMDIKKRELGKPKKPPSAYLSFVQAKAQERGQEPFKEWQQKIIREWETAPASLKDKLQENYNKQMERYRADLDKWEQRMVKEGHFELSDLRTRSRSVFTKPTESMDDFVPDEVFSPKKSESIDCASKNKIVPSKNYRLLKIVCLSVAIAFPLVLFYSPSD